MDAAETPQEPAQNGEPAAPKRRRRPREKTRSTISDLSRVTGFSPGTITRAFANSPKIRLETKNQILAAADKLGYHPHHAARLLRASRTNRWGILLPSFTNPYYGKLYEAFDEEARRIGTSLQLGLFHYNPALTDGYLRAWATGEIDGLIADCGLFPTDFLSLLTDRRIPVVFLHDRPDPSYDAVMVDSRRSMTRAFSALEGFGHKHVAFAGIINGTEAQSCCMWREWFERRTGMRSAEYSCFVGNNSAGGAEAWKILSSLTPRPTAVIAFNDIVASGIMDSARREGIAIPGGLSVIGSDDIDEASRSGLTTSRSDLSRLAAVALQILEARRQPDPPAPRWHFVDAEFLLRDSLGPMGG